MTFHNNPCLFDCQHSFNVVYAAIPAAVMQKYRNCPKDKLVIMHSQNVVSLLMSQAGQLD